MKTVKHCIRCQSDKIDEVLLKERQSANLRELNALVGLEVKYDNCICDYCRSKIGNEIAESMLNNFNTKQNESRGQNISS